MIATNRRMHKLVFGLSAIAISACTAGEPLSTYQPVADNQLLMAAVIDPAADHIWGAAGTIITAEGAEEIMPRSEEEWTAVRNSAVLLAESGNLLMMVPRAKDDQEWMRLSRALIDSSVNALQAAERHDVERVFVAGGEIYAVCTNCHSKYSPEIASRVN